MLKQKLLQASSSDYFIESKKTKEKEIFIDLKKYNKRNPKGSPHNLFPSSVHCIKHCANFQKKVKRWPICCTAMQRIGRACQLLMCLELGKGKMKP